MDGRNHSQNKGSLLIAAMTSPSTPRGSTDSPYSLDSRALQGCRLHNEALHTARKAARLHLCFCTELKYPFQDESTVKPRKVNIIVLIPHINIDENCY